MEEVSKECKEDIKENEEKVREAKNDMEMTILEHGGQANHECGDKLFVKQSLLSIMYLPGVQKRLVNFSGL